MRLLFSALAPVWAFWGMVSCDDQGAVEARLRAQLQDPSAIVSCREPRAWHGEATWLCTEDLRGERTCYSLDDHTDYPARVPCPSTQVHKPTWEQQ